jgi:flavin reductase (DIM6/NTAB) family NADH-FMN oxidoreductase RutF
MHFDLAAIPERDAYTLLVSTVVPRPIALATTVDDADRVNEYRRITEMSLGARSTLEIGRVIHIRIRDDLVDPERYHVATDRMRLVGRVHGRGWYARTSDPFLMERISFAEWKVNQR